MVIRILKLTTTGTTPTQVKPLAALKTGFPFKSGCSEDFRATNIGHFFDREFNSKSNDAEEEDDEEEEDDDNGSGDEDDDDTK